MVSLENMFMALKQGLMQSSERYPMLNSEHVKDSVLGLEYHLYPDWKKKPYKITLNDNVMITGMEMTPNEAKVLEEVRKIVIKHFADKNRKELFDMYSKGAMVSDEGEPNLHLGNGNYS